MSRYRIDLVVFLAGLAAACWIAASYVGSNALALSVTLLIVVCYLAGALELRRYGQATTTLTRAVDGLSTPPASLAAWLEPVHPSLRNAVRLRVEGERVALPGPALTPYLVGLLVLLGMLGTLLGMVATLRGTGLALESATDLQAIRASLAAPVKGLGFAFGTSIAGVATSAMLGLLSALCRRARLEAAQMLDVKIATSLRIYSQAHQREESFKLMQRQAEVMPTLVDRLQTMMSVIEQQSLALNERQLASQEAFHGRTEAVYTRLAGSVERSLRDSVADSARAASAALQPVMEATMAGLARETATLHDAVSQAVQRQLDGLSSGFDATTAKVAGIWNDALAGHQRSSEELAGHWRGSMERVTEAFELRSAALLDGVSARLDATAGSVSQAWNDALSRQERAGEKLALDNQQALAAAAATFETHSASLLRGVGQSHVDLQTELASRDEQRLAAWTDKLGSMASTLSKEWAEAGTQTAQRQEEICETLAQTARDMSAQTQAHASDTIAEINRLVDAASEAPKAAANLHAEIASRDEERLVAWTDKLGSMATTLSKEWAEAGSQTAQRQEEICETLAQTARDMSAQTQAHASDTIAEINRLVDAAAEAPKAAANLHAEIASRDEERLVAWTDKLGSMASTLSKEWAEAGSHTAQRQQEICETLAQTARDMSAQTKAHASDTIAEINRLVDAASEAPKAAANLHAEIASRDEERLAAWTDKLGSMATTLSKEWAEAGSQTAQRQQEICETLAQTARDMSAQTQAHASETIAEINRLVDAAAEAPKAAANLHAEIASRDEQRLAAWTDKLGSMATTLSKEWAEAGSQTAQRQQEICETLAQTARDISAQTQAHASDTIAEIGQLVQAASEAPKAAAEVVAELRQKLSDSMVRDTAMLEERSRLLDTLETLLNAVNHASGEQRTAVDALVATSADLLERVGTRFTDHVELETGKLGAVAAQVTGSAVEVASLGEAFGAAVQMFGESNDKLVAHLQRIETALDKSLARSDEQLAYYVAQAREVVDLSVMSQKQIVEDLQHLARQRSSAGADAV